MIADGARQDFIIRRALVADAPAVHSILLSAKHAIPLADNFADEAHVKWVRDRCRDREVWLAEAEGQMIAVIVMATYEIFYLATKPTHLRNGAGRSLVRHAIQMLKRRYGNEWGITAKVRPENLPIVALLTSEGFRPHPVRIAQPGWLVYFMGEVR